MEVLEDQTFVEDVIGVASKGSGRTIYFVDAGGEPPGRHEEKAGSGSGERRGGG